MPTPTPSRARPKTRTPSHPSISPPVAACWRPTSTTPSSTRSKHSCQNSVTALPSSGVSDAFLLMLRTGASICLPQLPSQAIRALRPEDLLAWTRVMSGRWSFTGPSSTTNTSCPRTNRPSASCCARRRTPRRQSIPRSRPRQLTCGHARVTTRLAAQDIPDAACTLGAKRAQGSDALGSRARQRVPLGRHRPHGGRASSAGMCRLGHAGCGNALTAVEKLGSTVRF